MMGNATGGEGTKFDLNPFSCEVNEVQNNLRFNNFSCTDINVIDKGKAILYLKCMAALLWAEITKTELCGECAEVDLDEIGIMFADCHWRTEKYGCFQVGGPFISSCHPVSLPPQPVSCLELKLQLYTPLNPLRPQLLSTGLSNIESTNFNFDKNTTFFVGGWREGDFGPYAKNLIAAMLKITDENIIVFNWLKGSNTFYGQAVANARLLGKILAKIIKNLDTNFDYPPSMVHLVGHSVGAQLVGYAGKEVSKIRRITGLDPAGPYFNCEDGTVVNLDPSDAEFVDIIHSNAGELGTEMACGHVDFWPNGGKKQKGCNLARQLNKTIMNDILFCHHTMSIYFYISSMYDDKAPSEKCDYHSYTCDYFASKKCESCGDDNSQCIRMGYYADEDYIDKPQTAGPRYLITSTKEPHCDTPLGKPATHKKKHKKKPLQTSLET